jgi:hypothetical protein
VALWPDAAVAVPTVNDARCPDAVVAKQPTPTIKRKVKRGSIRPPRNAGG